MKLSLETIYTLVYGSGSLSELAAQKDMDAVLAYKIGRALKRLRKEAKDIEERRLALVEKFGEKIEGKGIAVPQEKLPDFNKEWMALLKEEIEVEVRALPRSEFMAGKAKLSPAMICDLLDILITDEGLVE